MHVTVISRGDRSGVGGGWKRRCVLPCVNVFVCVWRARRRARVHSDVFFIHVPKKHEPRAQQAPRPQWSVRVKQSTCVVQSTAFVLHSKSSGIILPLKYSVSQALLLWSPAISQTAEA